MVDAKGHSSYDQIWMDRADLRMDALREIRSLIDRIDLRHEELRQEIDKVLSAAMRLNPMNDRRPLLSEQVCQMCSAVVQDMDKHFQWHVSQARTEGELRAVLLTFRSKV